MTFYILADKNYFGRICANTE